MTLSNASNATISDLTGTFTITNDESAPTVTLTASQSSIAEDSGGSVTIATASVATYETGVPITMTGTAIRNRL